MELIASSQEQELHKGYPRDVKLKTLEGKITVCVGVRRCGKSTLMQQQFHALEERGVPRENILMLNFADERLAGMGTEGWNELYEAYYSMYPEKRGKEKVYFCFDKIQMQKEHRTPHGKAVFLFCCFQMICRWSTVPLLESSGGSAQAQNRCDRLFRTRCSM